MKKQITIGNRTFESQTECETYIREVLNEIGTTDSVKSKSAQHFDFLSALCERHPDHTDKLKNFVDFQIYTNMWSKHGLALNIVNRDDSTTEISWRICLTGTAKSTKTRFCSALRQCVSAQIQEFRARTDLSRCMLCKGSLKGKAPHIDHHEPQFAKLVEDFMELNKSITMPTEYDKKKVTFETLFRKEDVEIGASFGRYHLENATLRVLCETCNLTRKRYKKETNFR
jgi:hypothetical protein